MRRLLLAIQFFFRTLFDAEVARQFERIVDGEAAAEPAPPKPAAPPAVEPPKPKPKPPGRSDALTLLAALQREARFVDFIKESLDNYDDAQIGAVAREVHRDCGKVFERMFNLQPIAKQEEGAELTLSEGFDPGRYKLTGNVTNNPNLKGRLVHHGWEAAQCELAEWTGSQESARVVAPVEVEVS
jgi:hypothetical protein